MAFISESRTVGRVDVLPMAANTSGVVAAASSGPSRGARDAPASASTS